MIKIGSHHFEKDSIKQTLEEIEKNLVDNYKEKHESILKRFLKNSHKTEEQLIHDLVFVELTDLLKNTDYYINEYCQFVLWKSAAQINRKPNRIATIDELECILGTDSTLKNNFFPNFLPYTPEENQSKEKFKLYFDRICSDFEEMQLKLSELFSYKKFLFPHRIRLLEDMEVELCPYCNNHTIMTDEEKAVSEADMDHFLIKAKFCLFGASFGNILPSCKSCNSTHKNVSLIGIINPRVEGFGKGAVFTVSYKGIEALYTHKEEKIESKNIKVKFAINETDPNKKKRINNSITLFKLEKQYNTSTIKREVRELFIHVRDWNSVFYQNAVNEFVDNKDYTQYMFEKIMCFETGSYDTEDTVNVSRIKLKYDLLERYIENTYKGRSRRNGVHNLYL